jgi:hypothetical protein
MARDPIYPESMRRIRRAELVHWADELVLVFVGGSAAFPLNNYQGYDQEARHRDQILASLERLLEQGIESGKVNAAQKERERGGVSRRAGAGKMRALLQSGGVQLLDVETLAALRNDESVIDWGLRKLQRSRSLSDELIVPNLGQDISFFYDRATWEIAESIRDLSRSSATDRCNSRMIWIESIASYSNASRQSAIGNGGDAATVA